MQLLHKMSIQYPQTGDEKLYSNYLVEVVFLILHQIPATIQFTSKCLAAKREN